MSSNNNCLNILLNRRNKVHVLNDLDLFSNVYSIPELVSLILSYSLDHEKSMLFMVSKYFSKFRNYEPHKSKRKELADKKRK
jgi:hypothetical protein